MGTWGWDGVGRVRGNCLHPCSLLQGVQGPLLGDTVGKIITVSSRGPKSLEMGVGVPEVLGPLHRKPLTPASILLHESYHTGLETDPKASKQKAHTGHWCSLGTEVGPAPDGGTWDHTLALTLASPGAPAASPTAGSPSTAWANVSTSFCSTQLASVGLKLPRAVGTGGEPAGQN